MARPRERTETLRPDEIASIKQHLVTVKHAWETLCPGGRPVSWGVFRLALLGKRTRPSDLAALRQVVRGWKDRTLKNPLLGG